MLRSGIEACLRIIITNLTCMDEPAANIVTDKLPFSCLTTITVLHAGRISKESRASAGPHWRRAAGADSAAASTALATSACSAPEVSRESGVRPDAHTACISLQA